MRDNETESADDERSLFARVLRRSADELEQPDDENGDGAEPDVEQRADDENDDGDEMDETEQEADPIDTALESGTISAAEASAVRDVAERMDDGGVQTLIDAISENDLDVEDAVDMIEAYNGDGGDMPAPDDGDGENAPEELKARADEDGTDDAGSGAVEPSDEEIAALESRLDAVDELGDRLDEIEQRLDDPPTEEDVETQVEQRLEKVGEDLDEEFEGLIQRAEVVGSPNPTAGATDEDQTLGDVVRIGGGDSGGDN